MEGGESSNGGEEEERVGQWSVQYTCQTSSPFLSPPRFTRVTGLLGWVVCGGHIEVIWSSSRS